VAQTYGPSWHFFGRYQNDSFHDGRSSLQMQLSVRPASLVRDSNVSDSSNDTDIAQSQLASQTLPQPSYASLITRALPAQASVNSASLTPANAAPGMPVFVLTTGALLPVSGYGYTDSRITYTLVGGGTGVISTNDVDWNTTTQLNAQRGVRVTLHNSHANAGTPGF
jgi:hypothetical protein